MTPELARLMRNARDYPNTATVDHLCAGIVKALEGAVKSLEGAQAEMEAKVAAEREACAGILDDYLSKWANDMDEGEAEDLRDLRDLIRQRGSDCEHCRAEAMTDNERARSKQEGA